MNRLGGTAVAAAGALTAVTGCGLSFGATTDHEDRAYTVRDALTALKIRGPAANVEITGADVARVTVRERLEFTEHRRPASQHSVANGELYLRYRCPGQFMIGTRSCRVSYRIQVPRRTTADIATGAGGLRVRGLDAAVTSDIGTGDTDLGDVRGPLRLTTGAGTITARGLRAAPSGEVHARSRAGDIDLTFATPPGLIETSTGTGTTGVRVPSRLRYAVDADAELGSERITVTGDPASPHRIRARSATGDIAILPS